MVNLVVEEGVLWPVAELVTSNTDCLNILELRIVGKRSVIAHCTHLI
jgi:hypothetical protein